MLRTLGWVWLVITLILLGYGLHVALTVPPDADQGNVGRILYYHVPTWVAMSLCFLTNLIRKDTMTLMLATAFIFPYDPKIDSVMDHQNLVIAYYLTWLVQLCYLGYVVRRWYSARNQK